MVFSRVTELERLIPGETKEVVRLRAQISDVFDAELDRVRATDDNADGRNDGVEQNEQALRESEARLRRAIQIPTVGIVFFNLSGLVTDANEAFLRMIGYTTDDVRQRLVRWDQLTPPEWRPHFHRAEEELKALGQTTPYEKEYIRKNGSRGWALFAATRLSEYEGVEYLIDITERKVTEEQLHRYKDDLELRVQARTTELDSINGALREEITERHRAEQVRHELLRRLVTAEEEERRRISRELHDEIGQHLAALMLGLKSLDNSTNPAPVSSTLKALQAITETVGREIHELALELRPTALDDLGLLRTLSNYVDQWSSRANVEVDFHSSGWAGERLPPHIEATVFRIVQEALTNVLKHARATRVSLIVERRPDQATVIIEDNGAGFDLDGPLNQPNGKSLGLLGMKERAALIDGELKVEASLGKGTTVFVRIPLPRSASSPS